MPGCHFLTLLQGVGIVLLVSLSLRGGKRKREGYSVAGV